MINGSTLNATATPFRERVPNRRTPITAAKKRVERPASSEPKTARKSSAMVDAAPVQATPQKNLFSRYLLRTLEPTETAPTLTVVLDLDETLVSNRRLDLPAAILRPFVLDLLAALKQLPGIEVVLWTASTADTGSPVVTQLSANGTVFDDVIFRNDLWFTEPVHTKDLRLLGRDMDRVIVFDNAPNCCKLNRNNAMLVDDFTGYCDPQDNTLINVFRVCEQLIQKISTGGNVPDGLRDIIDANAICKRVFFQLPEAWRVVSLNGIAPLMIPPHGEYYKVTTTAF
jgi:hypothetical protein